MSTMKAFVFEKEGVVGFKEVDVPKIKAPDQILIKVDAVSICGTDVHMTSVPAGYPATPNTILGHELVGTVEKVGDDVKHLSIGDRVVVNPNNFCGTCVYCRKNLPNQCMHIEPLGIDFDGAFAQYCVVNGKTAFVIDKSVPVELAACAEPLACAINGLKKVNIKPADSVLIIGAGPIGLMMAMLAKASGANVYIYETSSFRFDFANKLNIGKVLNPIKQDVLSIINSETQIGVDFAFDMTGSQILPAINAVRKGGSVVCFGVNKTSKTEIAQSEITTKEIEVLGTWLANATFPEAVKVLEQNEVEIGELVTHVIPLDEVEKGLELLREGKAVKVVVKL